MSRPKAKWGAYLSTDPDDVPKWNAPGTHVIMNFTLDKDRQRKILVRLDKSDLGLIRQLLAEGV